MALGTWAISTANYWLEGEKWEEDIDFHLNVNDQIKRLFSLNSYRFDSNTFATNWQHALSGAVFYNFYRSNGFSLLQSFQYSVYTSLLWEFVTEYQEVISVNDMLYNSLGALTVGENLYQISNYLHYQKNGLLKSLGYLLNPINALNRLLDRKNQTLGQSDAQFLDHRGSLSFSLSKGDLLPQEGQQNFINSRVEIDLFPTISTKETDSIPLTWQAFFLAGHFSFSLTGNSSGINEYRLKMRNILLGWLTIQKDNSRHSNLLLFGLSNGFDLYRKKAIDPFDTNKAKLVWEPDRVIDHPVYYSDKISHLGIIGPSLLWIRQNPSSRLSLEGGFCFNFAMINSLPLNRLSHEQKISDTKVTLLYYGYYYALGYSCYVKGHYDWKPFLVEFQYDFQSYRSMDGLDRFQKHLIWDPDLSDSRSFLLIGLYLKPFKSFQLGCVLEQMNRYGSIDNFSAKEKEQRVSFSLGTLF